MWAVRAGPAFWEKEKEIAASDVPDGKPGLVTARSEKARQRLGRRQDRKQLVRPCRRHFIDRASRARTLVAIP